MLALRNPTAAYRAIEFDARVDSATPHELVAMCYEQVISALGRALIAHDRGDNRMKSEALTRDVSALTALQMGVTGDGAMSDALHQLYTSARHTVLNGVVRFDTLMIARIRQDFVEIAAALGG